MSSNHERRVFQALDKYSSPRLHFDIPGDPKNPPKIETVRLIAENSEGEGNIFLNFNEFIMMWFKDSAREARRFIVQINPSIDSKMCNFPEGDRSYLITFGKVEVFFNAIKQRTDVYEDDRQKYIYDTLTMLIDQIANSKFELYNILTVTDPVQRGIRIRKFMSPKPKRKRKKKKKQVIIEDKLQYTAHLIQKNDISPYIKSNRCTHLFQKNDISPIQYIKSRFVSRSLSVEEVD